MSAVHRIGFIASHRPVGPCSSQLLPKIQAETKSPVVRSRRTERSVRNRADIVAKLQPKAAILREPVIDSAAEVHHVGGEIAKQQRVSSRGKWFGVCAHILEVVIEIKRDNAHGVFHFACAWYYGCAISADSESVLEQALRSSSNLINALSTA